MNKIEEAIERIYEKSKEHDFKKQALDIHLKSLIEDGGDIIDQYEEIIKRFVFSELHQFDAKKQIVESMNVYWNKYPEKHPCFNDKKLLIKYKDEYDNEKEVYHWNYEVYFIYKLTYSNWRIDEYDELDKLVQNVINGKGIK